MIYLVLKSLHIIAAMVWAVGMVAHPWLVTQLGQQPLPRSDGTQLLLANLRRWDRVSTGVAMGLVFALGIWMGAQAGWFSHNWWRLKFALAFALGGLHGVGARQVRKMAADPNHLPLDLSWVRVLNLLVISALVTTAVVKPSIP